jgi:hypothetical protein
MDPIEKKSKMKVPQFARHIFEVDANQYEDLCHFEVPVNLCRKNQCSL